LVAEVYEKSIDIVPDDRLLINRSLNADRFSEATGYSPLPWNQLIHNMRDFG
jgi:dTDP-4-dehydrorhamnose reductase